MSLQEISNWFLSSVLGILILGSFGSVIGFFIIKLLSWVWKKYIISGLNRFLFYPCFRDFLIKAALIRKFQSEGNDSYIIILYIESLIEFTVSAIVVFILILATFLLFIFKGIESAILLSFFVALSLLSALWFVKSALNMAGCDIPKLTEIKEQIKTKIKTPDDFMKVLLDKKE